MQPTIDNFQQIEILQYGDAEPQPGDIVAFRSPRGPRYWIVVSRIVAQSGDTVEIRDGAVVVNGAAIEEPYFQGETKCAASCAWILPPPNSPQSADADCPTVCYFVLGDNRSSSADSRYNWLVPAENILGWIDR